MCVAQLSPYVYAGLESPLKVPWISVLDYKTGLVLDLILRDFSQSSLLRDLTCQCWQMHKLYKITRATSVDQIWNCNFFAVLYACPWDTGWKLPDLNDGYKCSQHNCAYVCVRKSALLQSNEEIKHGCAWLTRLFVIFLFWINLFPFHHGHSIIYQID